MLPSDLFLLSDTSGAATTASRLGHPDLAIATMNDFVEVDKFIAFSSYDRSLTLGIRTRKVATMVCSLNPSVPVIADADTG